MNKLLNESRIAFLIWILWIPAILFFSHLLISTRNGSIFSFFFLSIALLCMKFLIGKISKYLENIMFKEINYVDRIIKQCIYGFLIPLCSLAILIIIYDKFFDDNAIQRTYLIKELFVIVIFFYVTNAFYLVIHIDRQFSLPIRHVEADELYHEKVIVYNRGSYVPVNLMEIALIHQKNQINWLITFTGEEHILELSLKTIYEILNVNQYFKINRTQIVNKDVICVFRPASFGKIELELKINAINATVSKDRAKDFRKWFYK